MLSVGSLGPGFDWAEPYAIGLVIVGLAVYAAVGALSHEEDRAFSASVVYVLVGIAAAVVIWLAGLDWLSPARDAAWIEHLTELALIVALFSTGLKLERPFAPGAWGATVRLLAIAMPLSILLVALFGSSVMGLPVAAAILLGAALAPTDPVLAGDIGVGPPGDEEEEEPRFSITAEAGLNDGLALPLVVLAFILSEQSGGEWVAEWLLVDVLYGVLVGVALGAALGYGMSALVVTLRDRGLVRAELDGWISIGSVLVVYGIVELVSANGFLAAFAAGVAFRRYEQHHEVHKGVHEGAEVAGKFGELAVLLLLGSLLTPSGLAEPGWAGWALAALLLLVVRPVTVAVAFVRSPLTPRERLFLGWFGVRGVASLYYAAAALAAGVLPREEEAVLFWTVVVAVVLSIFAHGTTASPLTLRLLERRRPSRAATRSERDGSPRTAGEPRSATTARS
ncbi:MAG TPA: cation:proton antiporter [Gaiella sp.]